MVGADILNVSGVGLVGKYVFKRFWCRNWHFGDFQPPFSKLLATPPGGALGALCYTGPELAEAKNRKSIRARLRVLDTHEKSIYYNILKKLAHQRPSASETEGWTLIRPLVGAQCAHLDVSLVPVGPLAGPFGGRVLRPVFSQKVFDRNLKRHFYHHCNLLSLLLLL